MNTIEPYKKRSARFIKQAEFHGWRIKVYGMSAASGSVSSELVNEAIERILPQLPYPASSDVRYGAGFLIIHQGTLRNWFLLDWWEHEDILFHKLFSSPLNNPGLIEPDEESFAAACVHELRVISFESEAWIKTVLRNEPKPDVDEYMRQVIDEGAA